MDEAEGDEVDEEEQVAASVIVSVVLWLCSDKSPPQAVDG